MTEAGRNEVVAILGYGNQGAAHALNLRDSGRRVIVGARSGRGAEARAKEANFDVFAPAEAAARAQVVAMLVPDEAVPEAWGEVGAALQSGACVVFAHGFNLLYGALALRADADAVLVAPTGPGRVLRQVYERGDGLPAYLAGHQDGTGRAWARAEDYADALGCARARLWRTTVREETEVDLFGEQSVLCGGMNELVTAAWETLVAAGYSPEIAYLECVHQLKFLADLLHERGVSGLRRGISGTALYGDVSRGARVIGPASRAAMREMLEEIRSGSFARELAGEMAAGRPTILRETARAAAHPMEAARRRALGLPES
ncbi:MAG: ketol-acid reductoisomerase [Candidatus Eisenbacteria bacterium]|uniref:Ketol-acid reductoisomerase n=1 Tax=Eiseniibacteriota bacterium TaxID=2212470 RepID=A0A933SFC1_UNCEI|nr:ketol-acid reductoisomerase [Candidatus Eisenbacteria bacterium]